MKRHFLILFTFNLLLLMSVAANLTALGAPGDLDATFGNGGNVAITLTEASTGNGGFKGFVAPNGIIYQFGSTGFAGDISRAAIISLTSDGALNPTFDGDGKLVCDFPDLSFSRFYNGSLQPDGKILASGSALKNGLSWSLLARFLPNGQPDLTFNGTGYVLFRNPSILTLNFYWSNAVVQADGKIVTAGALGYQMAVARFLPNGAIDPSFGTNGYRIIQISVLGELWDMKLTTSGKIVAVGKAETSENNGNLSDFVVLQLAADGQLDTTFATGGINRFDLTPETEADAEVLYGVQILSNGKIVAAGRIGTATTDAGVVRFQANGQFDPSFGDGGYKIIGYGNLANLPQDLAIQTDGKIVLALMGGTSTNFLIQRLLPDGELDPSFGNGGTVETDLGGRDYPYSVSLTGDKILLAGYCGRNPSTNSIQKMCIARYRQNSAPTNVAALQGRAVNLLGRGIPNAQITVRNVMTDETQTVTTDRTGRFQLAEMPLAQQYILTPQANRCYFQNTPLIVNFTQPTILFALRANCFRVIR